MMLRLQEDSTLTLSEIIANYVYYDILNGFELST